MSTYYDELDFVRNAPDDIFPDFLFNPLYNDFEDGYYAKSFANDELISSVKKLRRRYSNFFDWADAMDTYNEYMDQLIDKYGSMRVIKNALRVDAMEDPVPAKPKLKMNRRNRQFLRSGVVPTRKINLDPIPPEEMIAIARQSFPNTLGDGVREEDADKKLPKETRKRLRRMSETLAGRNRKQNLYRSTGSNAGTDFIVEYLNQAKRGQYGSNGDYRGEEAMSLSERIRESERIENTRPELLEDCLENRTEIVNGRLVSRKQQIQMEIYKELYSQGMNVIGNFGKSMDKRAVKMVRSYIGDTEPASKKELKKIEKRTRKERERIQRRADNNALLEKTLLGNKFSMSDDGSSLSFRLKDIYRD